MATELIRYSQDVDMADTTKVTNFLVLRDHGREFRIRVSAETIQDLVKELLNAPIIKLNGIPPPPSQTMIISEPDENLDGRHYDNDLPLAFDEDGVPSL